MTNANNGPMVISTRAPYLPLRDFDPLLFKLSPQLLLLCCLSHNSSITARHTTDRLEEHGLQQMLDAVFVVMYLAGGFHVQQGQEDEE